MPEQHDPIASAFRSRLESDGHELRSGVAWAAIRQFENRWGVALPSDMASFYSLVDGMADSDYLDESVIRVFPLEDVRPVREEFSNGAPAELLQPPNAFVIADWSVAAHFYAIDLQSPGVPVFIDAASPTRVATGFSDFLRKVLVDDNALFHGEDAA